MASCLWVMPPAAFAQQRIVGIDANWNGAVIELDGPVHYHAFSMRHPDRLVLDIDNARLRQGLLSVDAVTGPLLRIRSAPRHQTDQRVVFDLRRAVHARLDSYDDRHGKYYIAVRFDDDDEGPAAGPQGTHPVRDAAAEPSCANPGRPGQFVVAIDAGHGGRDTGAIGVGGAREKDIALQIAYRLRQVLRDMPGIHPVLTRAGDTYIPLRERYRRAQACAAGLLVSVHTDSLPHTTIRGASVYVYPHYGAAPGLMAVSATGVDGESALIAAERKAPSYVAASLILHRLGAATDLLRSKVLRRHFTVLSSNIPSVLVETGFISDAQDEAELTESRHQQQLADAIAAGVRQYVDAYRRRDQVPRRIIHIAGTGGSLRALARRYAVSMDALRTANPRLPSALRAGDVMHIPLAAVQMN
ncbi:MAG: N-acetylmuramoyl-L-alanine amidase [Gammaproteobacteria bacterium]